MRSKWTQIRATLLMSIFLFSANAAAQPNLPIASTTSSEQRIALVIGNGAYKNAPLRNPPNDARLIARTLRSLGFQVIERIDADQRMMRRAIIEFAGRLEKVGGDGVGLVFYAGHGVQSGGRNYLIPTGVQIESEAELKVEAVSANELLEAMEGARSRLNIVILDACRDNPYSRRFRSAALGLARIEAPRGTLIAYATRPGDVAQDGAGTNSPYTAALANAMTTAGLPVTELFIRVRNTVIAATNQRQTPWEEGGLTSQFYFARGSSITIGSLSALPAGTTSTVADPSASERMFWESIKDSRNPAEYRAYLEQFSNGLFAGLARARLAALEDKPPLPSTAGIPPMPTAATHQTSVSPILSRPPLSEQEMERLRKRILDLVVRIDGISEKGFSQTIDGKMWVARGSEIQVLNLGPEKYDRYVVKNAERKFDLSNGFARSNCNVRFMFVGSRECSVRLYARSTRWVRTSEGTIEQQWKDDGGAGLYVAGYREDHAKELVRVINEYTGVSPTVDSE